MIADIIVWSLVIGIAILWTSMGIALIVRGALRLIRATGRRSE